MADFVPLGSVSTVAKHNRAKHQNFHMNKNGTYYMLVGSIRYPGSYKPEEITPEVLALRDERRAKQGMSKAQY